MKKFLAVTLMVLSLFVSLPLSAGSYTSDQQQGFDAYRKNDWTSAMFFLRKAGSSSAGYDPETLYMLVMSEMYATEYKSALSDANLFLQKFASSRYAPYMHFQKGRALHFLGNNEDAVLVLSDFCHQNPKNELYASALYWIAECFYNEYNFDYARSLYERVVQDFPTDAKATDSRYRIEMIAQREREEKLVYLLKVTGEENLAAREDYERQIKLYQTEDKMGLRKSLSDAEARIAELESLLSAEKSNSAMLESQKNEALKAAQNSSTAQDSKSIDTANAAPAQSTVNNSSGRTPAANTDSKVRTDPEVEALKRKARHLQYLLDERYPSE